ENLSSQIDEIWIPQQIIHIVTQPTLTSAIQITHSDYCIIHTNLQLYVNPPKCHKKHKFKTYKYDTMTPELWDQFQQDTQYITSQITETIAHILSVN
ncbi:3413_t:CDS:1, partial [Ambispora leptoticha]